MKVSLESSALLSSSMASASAAKAKATAKATAAYPSPLLSQASYGVSDTDCPSVEDPSLLFFNNEVRARQAVQYAMISNPEFDRFDVHSIVGYGANAAVVCARYRNKSDSTARSVAVKIIYKNPLYSTTASDTWAPEVLLHRRLSTFPDHPNVLKSYEHFQDEKHFYLVTDLVDGNWLSELNLAGVTDLDAAFSFYNPRTDTTVRLCSSLGGSSDLWAWSIKATNSCRDKSGLPIPVDSGRLIFAQIALAAHRKWLFRKTPPQT